MSAGDFFPNRYYSERYFPPGYFQGGEQVEGAINASIGGVASVSATLTAVAVTADVEGNKGGWDPYYYKPRRKKAKKRDEVDRFLSETAQLETAPAPVQEAAEDARDAAQDYLAALHQASQREAQRLLAEALDRIDAFYEAAREAAEEEEEIELLLLS